MCQAESPTASIPPDEIYKRLLSHYDAQHWWPADTAFEVMVGALLTQNTNWRNVEKAIDQLKSADMLNAQKIIACDINHLESLIRPSGFFRQKAARLKNLCQFYIQHGGVEGLQQQELRPLRTMLLQLNGIGPETADSILLYALSMPIFVVDAYTRRIFSRLGLIAPTADYDSIQQYFHLRLERNSRLFNEYHALIVTHAKQHCRLQPDCQDCPLAYHCPASMEHAHVV